MLIIFIVTIESWFFSKVLWGSRIPLVFLLAIGQASFQSGSIKEKRHRMGLQHHPSLVCGLEHLNYVFHILRIVILTDFHIFHRGWNHQPDHRNIRSPSDSSDFVPCKLVYKPHELYVVRYIHHRSPYIYIYLSYVYTYIYILLISPVNTIVISTINLWFFVATFLRQLNANGGPIGILTIKNDGYPLVMSNIAIENGHRNSRFTHWKWWIFPVRFLGQFTRG